MSRDAQRILALDPALRTGWAYRDGEAAAIFGVWTIDSAGPDGARLDALRRFILTFAEDHGVDRIAAEDARQGTKFHRTTVFHSELRGIIKLCAFEIGVPIVLVNPSTLKAWACGNGRAPKGQMIRACKTLLGIETDDDNVADALFVLEAARQGIGPANPAKPKRRPRRRSQQSHLF